MRIFAKKWHTSIFVKILIVYLVVIIPVYVICIIINEKGTNVINNQISKSLLAEVHFYKNSLEKEVEHIQSIQKGFFSDKDLIILSLGGDSMTNYDRVYSVSALWDKLNLIKGTSEYIKDVSIYIPIIGQTISTNNTYSDVVDQDTEVIINTLNTATSPIIYLNNRILLSIERSKPYAANKMDFSFLFNVELSVDELKNSLMQFTSSHGGGAALICSDNGTVIENEKDKSIIPYLKAEIQKSPDSNIGTRILNINKKYYYMAYEKSDYLRITLVVYTPVNQVLGALTQYHYWFWVLACVSGLVIIIFSLVIYRIIYRPLQKLILSFQKVDQGELEISIKHKSNDEFGYLYEHFNIMVEKLKEMIRNVYEQRILTQQSEMQHLQSQINPHFLYNSLFIIYRMAKVNDNENVAKFSQWLGNYFQFITRSYAKEVPFDMEISHAKIYIEIQNMRFSNRMSAYIDDLSSCWEKVKVPRLIIQPIIENAYEHGLKNKEENGIIRLRILEKEGFATVVIEDNGEDLDDEDIVKIKTNLSNTERDIEGTGMYNVHRRIKLYFGQESGLYVCRSELGGLEVDMKLFKAEVDGNV